MKEILTPKEQRILGVLYKTPNCSVSRLAKETVLNRTSLYPILEKLIAKGLVSAFTQDGVTIYEPIEPTQFKMWLKKKNDELAKQTTELTHWLDSTTKAQQAPSLVSKLKYFEGFDGVRNMYADTWRNNESKMIYAITDVKAAVTTMGDFFYNEYMPARIAHQVKVKDIMTDNEAGSKEVKMTDQVLREARLAKGLFEDLGVEINIYENKLAIAAYDKERPCGVIIENEKIASAMKNIFEYLWGKT